MDVSLFDFQLPEELIAQTPIADRSRARMMVLNRESGAIEHKHFTDLLSYLQAGDVLVLNDSRVRPARLLGIKAETGAQMEVLLLKPLGDDRWEALVKPAKRVKPGTVIHFGEGLLRAVAEATADMPGGWHFQLQYEAENLDHLLEELGEMPLPPYIRERLDDADRYQTVYARQIGSAAAPTAGLHFTPDILQQIEQKGVKIAPLTLHVGLGTFRPVTAGKVEEHTMHAEYYELGEESAAMIQEAQATGGRIIAVGTTSVRTLESVVQQRGKIEPSSGWTDIFIYPGYNFQAVDAMVTNFHLPRSSLLMLISAFASREHVLSAYQAAVEEQYRFFSFGDAMLIL
ncbi:tRNA preQ1(34) S-adenosylmethionine ribosyltransferase-isomerase QueA [Mechercharimyces sp. CAU 1602]|uniref:tRNA preQ1(34) S-adenosylmethionine ribosyltransferase-isomerase QueA n=1 Tax=Mechercharimyces sp. CAU 1602 TaxID=2973933 RepID=UPI00216177AC|nr:tRNA preQ1(34) S-adenosylmethionine ribosyltransferase-isomerase QueA [Mechercharimyces sp. CAU 1602]MCS1351408.1 tRNA preQ1(34) S-adenosylmethionine ribosyltransferase-isomerase QueA [Mechercharimyces sp. CAU 1602]